ncbi:Cys-tRNA(Pro) deacylase [Vibrio genomosp. F10]|uniref:Cys-tRNA(Pro)/Cys-tRNA(Cys) deacylase n=2 Tax=Vibrio genomosp. F10 TaxID=723171 RepID=A0A1B9QZ44_9VIBR|nr:Cys-tRNA(Pro) deacylase [Vibrio genomosp. F10]OCH76304.1 aminoacyl-tRNA deacylase [Vibrio genomosp. F10]OEE33999.1 aminoacyl-tRNA deacylase [Vibrio genomosp. F10 str. ZF-129]OEE97841.1 aminoacyl-tRNA deacylase [Vibrio genomosp. F10 str. 9ZD137]OEE97901.1 aminoacyl-tRNA deacylase [Vibrio genomosp. F10 str. 9ZC157]OEF09028.1 aminoacyl-tRNA deacylase [Vibrio genomosp. F10 str. 9ZB36]
MTPAIECAIKNKVPHKIHQYEHDPRAKSFGLEAAEVLGQDPSTVFKTLLFCLNGEPKNLAVAIIPVENQLSLKLAAKAAKAKKAAMADANIAQKVTGYVVGGISPLGQKKRLPTFIHMSATERPSICVSAGKRGLEIELSPQDLAQLTHAHFACLCD